MTAEMCNEALKLAQLGGLLLGLNGALVAWCWKSPRVRESLAVSGVETSWTAFLIGSALTFILGVAILIEGGC